MTTLFLTPALLLFALLSYFHHRAAVILLAGLLPAYLLRFSVFGIPTNFFELAIIVVALAGLVQPAIRSHWITAWRRLPFAFLLLTLFFILAASLSTLISPHPLTSLGILKSWILIPILFGWLIYSVTLWRGEGWVNCCARRSPALAGRRLGKLKIINTLLASGVAVSVIGLFQVFTLDRVKSVYDVPASLALFLAPLLVIALWQKRWLYAAPIALALLATQSVAALIAVALTLLLGIILWANSYQKKRSLLALTLVLILATAYLTSTGRLGYLARSPNSISVRRQLWSISWELIKKHPVLGIGLGTFEPAYQQKLHERFSRQSSLQSAPLPEFVFRDPHNWILSFWLNTGLLGLLSFAGLHVWTFLKLFENCRARRSSEFFEERRLGKLKIVNSSAAALAAALVALALFGLADTIYWKNDLAALHWLLLALLWRPHRRRGRT